MWEEQQQLLTNSDNSRQASLLWKMRKSGKWKRGQRGMQILGYNNDVIMPEVPYMVIASL